jgi:hypothetical protein
MVHLVRRIAFLICLWLTLAGCERVVTPKELGHEAVEKELALVYSLYSHQEPMKADSVVRELLRYSMSRADSISLARSYVFVLLALDSGKSALKYLEIGFPENGADDFELMRRHSCRFQAFMADEECDSAWAELARGFILVDRNDKLQLKRADLELNEGVLAERCPR